MISAAGSRTKLRGTDGLLRQMLQAAVRPSLGVAIGCLAYCATGGFETQVQFQTVSVLRNAEMANGSN